MSVRVVPCQPHCFAFGGFDLQMLDALEAARAQGVAIERLDPWSRDAAFDTTHFWGGDVAHRTALRWARQAGKRTVMTVLLPYPGAVSFARATLSALRGGGGDLRRLFRDVDRLVVMNPGQLRAATLLFGVPRERIVVIPNVVSPIYTRASPPADDGGYLVCVGNVCARKNQLRVAQAAEATGTRMVFVGRVLTGEEEYGREFQEVVERCPQLSWIPGLEAASERLVALYRQAHGFVLLSVAETQPISVLEANAVGLPNLLADRPWARQREMQAGLLADPASVDDIGRGLAALMSRPRGAAAAPAALRRFGREEVGAAYGRLYAATACADEATRAARRTEGGVSLGRAIARIGFELSPAALKMRVKTGVAASDRLGRVFLGAMRGRKKALAVDAETRFVVEGFPRSGNTFAVCAFEHAQGGQGRVRLAHHLHSIANVHAGLRAGLPVLVLVRDPRDAIASYAIRHPEVPIRVMLREYVAFYHRIQDVIDQVVLATFDEAVSGMGDVIARINARFGTDFARFEHTEANERAVFDMIDRLALDTGDATDSRIARPNERRQAMRGPVLERIDRPEIACELARARCLCSSLVASARS